MSLRVNTNVEAFDAHRNLQRRSTRSQRAMQKLSSGLRINSAADDAAGLAISEKMTRRSTAPIRHSATRWTASRSSRPQKAPTTRCTRSCSASASCPCRRQNGTLSTSDHRRDRPGGRPADRRALAHLREHPVQRPQHPVGHVHPAGRRRPGLGQPDLLQPDRDQLLAPSAAPPARPRSPRSTPRSPRSRMPAPPSARSRTGSRTPSTTSASTRRTSPPHRAASATSTSPRRRSTSPSCRSSRSRVPRCSPRRTPRRRTFSHCSRASESGADGAAISTAHRAVSRGPVWRGPSSLQCSQRAR